MVQAPSASASVSPSPPSPRPRLCGGEGRKNKAGREGRKRARTALVWTLALFAFLQAGLAVAVERAGPWLLDPLYGDKAALLRRSWQPAADGDAPFSVLMLGSSRTVFGLRGQKLGERLTRDLGRPARAFNFGVAAAGPVTDFLYYRRLRTAGIRPDLLLVEVLPPFLTAPNGEPFEVQWLSLSRLRPEEQALARQYGFPPPPPITWADRTVPAYAHRLALMGRLAPEWLPAASRMDSNRQADPTGWTATADQTVTPSQYCLGVEQTRRQYAAAMADFRLSPDAGAALRELLAECGRDRVAVALVLMPEGSVFRGWYPPAGRAAVEAFLAGLGREFGVPLIDAREWVTDAGFSDGHHLLAPGAAAFTDRLGAELPALLRRPNGASEPRRDR